MIGRAFAMAAAVAAVYGLAQAMAIVPMTEEEATEARRYRVADIVSRSDVVLHAIVEKIEAETTFGSTIGDWAFMLTGKRLGLESTAQTLEIKLKGAVVLRGPGAAPRLVRLDPTNKGHSDPWGGRDRLRLVEGREYVLYCKRGSPELVVLEFDAVADEPGILDDVRRAPPRPYDDHVTCRGRDVSGASFSGVVFPPECDPLGLSAMRGQPNLHVATYWLPTAADVAKAESGLRGALEAGRKVPESLGYSHDSTAYVSRELDGILKRLGDYRRQYLGLQFAAEHRRILMNFFPTNDARHEDWRQHWVRVDNGGDGYWHIEYDVDAGSYRGFDIRWLPPDHHAN